MKLNEDTVIHGNKVILVPYKAEHVPVYHDWMQSEELLELTASERLSLEEEYEMQRKWHLDEDKLTFIILARPDRPEDAETPLQLNQEEIKKCRMVGDVNMFIPGRQTELLDQQQTTQGGNVPGLEDGDKKASSLASDQGAYSGREGGDRTQDEDNGYGDGDDHQEEEEEGLGECEIMIASKDDRRKGYAREALSLFLKYATSTLPIHPSKLLARIGTTNSPSIALFHSLGFETVKVVEVFQEAELRFIRRSDKGEMPWEKIDLQGRIGTYD